jgi:hypothetical protein
MTIVAEPPLFAALMLLRNLGAKEPSRDFEEVGLISKFAKRIIKVIRNKRLFEKIPKF